MSKLFRVPLTGTIIGVGQDRHGSATRSKTFSTDRIVDTNLSVRVFDKDGNERKVKDYFGSNAIQRAWYKWLYRDGRTVLDLGSGKTTNVQALAVANEWNLAAPSGAAINTIKLANSHVTGTGATPEAATDIKLQTQSTNGGQTPVAGTQTLISAANVQKYQTVATISYTGTEGVTEWGLLVGTIGGLISATTGTPFTAGSATTGTVTGTPLTASSSTVQGQQQTIFENTGNATPSWGLVTSNTTGVVTVPAWYKVSDGTAGVNPANGNAYTIRPVLYDHKVFSAINVNSGDSIQFTYQLTIASNN